MLYAVFTAISTYPGARVQVPLKRQARAPPADMPVPALSGGHLRIYVPGTYHVTADESRIQYAWPACMHVVDHSDCANLWR